MNITLPANASPGVRRCVGGGGETLSNNTARFTLDDAALFLRALVMARKAQLIRRLPVPEVVEEISRLSGGGQGHRIQRLEAATARAIGRWRRWLGGVDTCLTRSLVLGGLLVGRGEVALNLGFRPGEEESALDGHAWVTIDGEQLQALTGSE